MRLSELKKNKTAKIKKFLQKEINIIKFLEMGILPGEQIQVIRRAPLGGPLQIRIGSSNLYIRKNQASNIIVQV